jgi:NCAIR mutase (PurE)-related protein
MMPDESRLRALLAGLRDGKVSLDDAQQQISDALREEPFEELSDENGSFARVDHHRAIRQGFPEVILCSRKTPAQVAHIAHAIAAHGNALLATRADTATFEAVRAAVPQAEYSALARVIHAPGNTSHILPGKIGVLCAGTSDLPVAEEAAVTLAVMGAEVQKIYEVGVAGLHRLLAAIEEVRACDVIIVVAGMEGALPSVVGGLVDCPVIAVPTSVGYGASFGGLAALLGMLNSCASGITVVNIDNGFGAAMGAAKILRLNQK